MQHILSKLLARPKQASLLAFCLSLLVFSVVAANVLIKQKHANQSIALSLARSQASLLQNTIDKNLSANYALASLVIQENGQTTWFPTFAISLHKVYPDVSNFALSPNGVVQQVYPLKGNEQAIGFNQLADSKQGLEAWQAKTDNRLTLAGPLNLVQGGKGVVGRLPVYIESRSGKGPVFWGFTNVVVRLDAILGYVNLATFGKNDFDYRLVKINEDQETPPTVIASSVEQLSKEQVSVDIKLPNITWRLSVSPMHGWLSDWALFGTIFVLFLASVVLGRLVYLALKTRQSKANLETIVEQRTHELSSSNKRMSAIFAAIPDSFYEVTDDGVVIAYHSPRMDELYQKSDWPIGKHFSELLHEDAVPIFEGAMAEAREYGYSNGYEYYFDFGSDRRWFEVSGTYSTDENRQGGFYILLSREITHRKEVESELRIAATAFQTQDGIFISDKENKIIRVNSAFEEITGYKEFEVIGHTPNIISSGRHPKNFYRDMFQHLKNHESWEGEIWNRRKNGEIFPEWLSISVVKDEHGELTHYVATFKDITEDKANERRINQLNYYDTLTRLPNRRMVTEDIDHMLSNIDLRNRRSAILFIDLDHFKDVNDVKGHHLGDMLLQQVASRLMDSTRSGDTVARFSGDEFIVVLEDVDISLNPDRIAYRAKHVASKIMTALGQPFELDGHPYTMTASIGIAILGEDVISSDDIIKHAEMAMYEAKGEGRNRVCFYAPQMHEKILERVTFDNSFRAALQNNEFVLYYQPQWNTERKMVGVEALVRWFHPAKGMISPGVFIPFAEESKLILPLGRWVMESAMRQLAQWQKADTYPNLVMSINVSVMQFAHEEFVAIVEDSLAITGVNPAFIQLELTESMLVRDQLDIIQKMQALKRLGVLISLDDFGTGYSSLSYLQQLPIDQLKIDQSFTRAIEESDKQASLAATIIGLGHNLGMEVIAEGVETEAQFAWLKEHGCDLYQGFLLGRPQPVSELEKNE